MLEKGAPYPVLLVLFGTLKVQFWYYSYMIRTGVHGLFQEGLEVYTY
jgi:hypothetical protein